MNIKNFLTVAAMLLMLTMTVSAERRLGDGESQPDIIKIVTGPESEASASAASSNNQAGYVIKSSVLSGGQSSASSDFRLNNAIGSAVAGIASSQEYIVYQGFLSRNTSGPLCVAGDADSSGDVDIDDPVFLLAYIFSGGPSPAMVCCSDADGNGGIDVDDVVYLLDHCFSSGPNPTGSC